MSKLFIPKVVPILSPELLPSELSQQDFANGSFFSISNLFFWELAILLLSPYLIYSFSKC